MTDFSPREMFPEPDRFIIGQSTPGAGRDRAAYAGAACDERLREEVLPKNILMIGLTGVGKTEIRAAGAALAGAVPRCGGHQVHRGRMVGRDE